MSKMPVGQYYKQQLVLALVCTIVPPLGSPHAVQNNHEAMALCNHITKKEQGLPRGVHGYT